MSELASFKFLMPFWLLLLPLLWGLVWFLARHHMRPSSWRKICDPHLLEKLGTDKSAATGPGWLTWPLAILLTLSVLAGRLHTELGADAPENAAAIALKLLGLSARQAEERGVAVEIDAVALVGP